MSSLILLLLFAKSAKLDDKSLAKRIKSGDHEAFRDVFDTLSPMLLGYLLRMGGRKEDAEDVIQQTFITLWEKRNEIDENRSLRAFLFRIATNRLLNVFRNERKFSPEHIEQDSFGKTHETITEQELTFQYFNKAVASLPEKRRHVFELCFIQQFTYKEAGEILGVTQKTIENHMISALKNIREAMKGFL